MKENIPGIINWDREKDLVIGAIDLYDWDKVKVWAKSIKSSGFEGDVALIVYRTTPEVINQCKSLGIDLYEVNYDDNGNQINYNNSPNGTHAHALRFFHIWQLLQNDWDKYRFVIITDVRDVVFQTNPSDWLVNAYGHYAVQSDRIVTILAPSEGILIKDEPWNSENIKNGFGNLMYDLVKDGSVCNIGTVAGQSNAMRAFCLLLFEMTKNRFIPSDQSSFNIIMHCNLINGMRIVDMDEGWSAQCATTHEPSRAFVWNKLITKKPIIKDGIFYNSKGEKFVMVHQYDRVPGVKEIIEEKYK